MKLARLLFITLMIFYSVYSVAVSQKKPAQVSKPTTLKYDTSLYRAMQWREIGPFRGGRSIAVAGHPEQPLTYYFGATGGGVWKTTDGGVTWVNISDGFFKSSSVGAIAVAESDPNVIYVGMGEACLRNNISIGDGVYKSEDAGKTWKHLGLAETKVISKIRVHPKDANIVFVAALGNPFAPSPERGVYKSTDGGKTWKKVLYKDEKTGAVDLVIDPTNPRVIYASMWEVYRNFWTLSSGGPGSGLWKSTDGGETWVEISNNPGFPKGIKGRIGIAVSPAKPDLVWALVEAENGGLFKSEDGGATWRKINDDKRLWQRPFYYMHVFADPKNPDVVYVLNVQFLKSIDGGRTFNVVRTPHSDHHDLWINPNNPDIMIHASDGGASVTFNGGLTWTEQDYPTAQFYHVLVDNQFPYYIYGAQQDNTTVAIASRTTGFGIDRTDWFPVGGGESGYIAVKPDNPDIVYAGSYGGLLTRFDKKTKETKNISVWPESPIGSGAKDIKYRFQWTYPIVISPHDPNVLYVTGNHVFRSTDEGMSWEVISPDLTRNDTSKIGPSGGPITKDNTTAEYYCTIYAFAESPVKKGVLWAGSDDGLIHVSTDNGKTWVNVTPKELPEWSLISIIEPSPFDAGTAYVAATRYKLGDFKPYIFKTTDYGKTWKKIVNGIPDGHFTRVVRADPNRKGLLYAGTEYGIYVSFDDGENWQTLQLNLPVTPIYDIAVQAREKDLVVATHGRSFWVLDDLTPLYQLGDEVANSDVYLFKPRDAYRMRGGGGFRVPGASIGQNPPNGVIVYYYFKEKPKDEVKLEFYDENGKLIKSFSSKPAEERPTPAAEEFGMFPGGPEAQRVPAEAGMNRFVWDMRYPDAENLKDIRFWNWGGTIRGPVAVPGRYQVKLIVGKKGLTQWFEIKKDPRINVTNEEFKEQFDLLIKIRDRLSDANRAVNTIRDVIKQMDAFVEREKGTGNEEKVVKLVKPLKEKLTAIEGEITQNKAKSSQDLLNHPVKLNGKLASLASAVASADSKPPKQMYEVFEDLSKRLDVQLNKLREVLEKDIPEFNRAVKELEIPADIISK
ncbi:VPS10 domain-containing protein [Candidatus Kryptonium thompsonii]|uniref:VPS10 domain-containing protein n=1 Tax=Candidatus Kryptonium thompsonii TaxID=1633631 RepID=UPI00063E7908|nr:glycosyl hydrolase [Candidatus Kryptonium thompsoni]CUS99287.1 Sortilin, neurotensin receptor 3 [Candidatus Kryptonium thompsoni]